jgi:hypothetical protein
LRTTKLLVKKTLLETVDVTPLLTVMVGMIFFPQNSMLVSDRDARIASGPGKLPSAAPQKKREQWLKDAMENAIWRPPSAKDWEQAGLAPDARLEMQRLIPTCTNKRCREARLSATADSRANCRLV